MPESIRNAIVVAFIAVLMAMVGVGLLAWSRRPAAPPPRRAPGAPVLVNDRDGISDMSLRLQQFERKLGESQVLTQRLIEQLQEAGEERERLTTRLGSLEKEIRSLKKRLQDAEQRLPPRLPPDQEPATGTPSEPGPAPATPAAPEGQPATAPF